MELFAPSDRVALEFTGIVSPVLIAYFISGKILACFINIKIKNKYFSKQSFYLLSFQAMDKVVGFYLFDAVVVDNSVF